nr:immunoglobulin heavy chain junction region [Macaca mulatta]
CATTIGRSPFDYW